MAGGERNQIAKRKEGPSIAGIRICANCKPANLLLLNMRRGNQIQESAKIAEELGLEYRAFDIADAKARVEGWPPFSTAQARFVARFFGRRPRATV